MDIAIDDEQIEKLRAALPDKEIIPISGVSHQGVRDLLERVWLVLHPPKD
jgi:hypothetical protein